MVLIHIPKSVHIPDALKNKLAAIINDEVATVLGVENELTKLQESLEMISCVLEDAQRKQIQSQAINHWLSKLRDVVYDADDVLDLCRIEGRKLLEEEEEQEPTRQWCCVPFLLSFLFSLPFRYKVGKRTRKLNERLQSIRSDQVALTLQQSANPDVGVRRETVSAPEPDLVGRDVDDAKNSLVALLLVEKNRQRCEICSVTGMAGIGKTTLAQEIFHDKRIADSFQIRSWLCVSQNFSERELLQRILTSCNVRHRKDWSKEDLVSKLTASVEGKSVFVVLDDMWRADAWNDLLRNPLARSKMTRARVLVTTRDERVARGVGSTHVHPVSLLPEDSGWDLLLMKAFQHRDPEDISSFKEIGTAIVNKCHGLPLAIKVMGGLLAMKGRSEPKEWHAVLNSHAWSMKELPEELKGAIYLSYEDLPSHLKRCFLYFSLFPEGRRFYLGEIVSLLVAEGFASIEEGRTPEESAEDCLNELQSRNLLQPNPESYRYNPFVVHDLLLSLARFLSKDECFFGDAEGLKPASKATRIRRASIYGGSGEVVAIPRAMVKQKSLRTLLLLKSPPAGVDNEQLVRLSNLRVLVLFGPGIRSLPQSLGNLVLLRCLYLSDANVSVLPESICRLVSLQILILLRCADVRTLPRGITQLSELRCLELSGTPLLSHVPRGIGALKDLNNLKGFLVGDEGGDSVDQERQLGCDMEELRPLEKLRYLSTHKLERAVLGAPSVNVLENKTCLRDLYLRCTPRAGTTASSEEVERIEAVFDQLRPPSSLENLQIFDFFGHRFPSWIMSASLSTTYPHLRSLWLWGCSSCSRLPPFNQLPRLQYVDVLRASAVKTANQELLCGGGSAATNEVDGGVTLIMREMANWEKWSLNGEGFEPSFGQLWLEKCPKLRALPEGLRGAREMKQLRIEGADRLRDIKGLPCKWLGIICWPRRAQETTINRDGRETGRR